MEKQKCPEIRFDGFKCDWEQTTLGNFTIFRRGSFPQPYGNKEWYGGKNSMPFVQVVDVRKDLKLVQDTKQKISLKAQSYSVFVPKGRVIVTLQGTIGRVAITQYDSFVDRTILIFEGFTQNTDSLFWAYTIQNKFDLEKKTAPGGTIKTITKNALSSFEVLLPLTEEQIQIGEFFKNLDQSIALYKKKLAQTQNFKKEMLEKMFPKQGSNRPEIRLKGFSGDWNLKILGDVSDIKTGPFGSTLHADDYVKNGTPIITTEHFKSGELPIKKCNIPQVSRDDLDRLKSYILQTDDIVFSRVGSVDINALVTDSQKGWLFSGRVLRVRSNEDVSSQYLHYELSTHRVRKDVITRAVGQTMPSINTEILKNTSIYLPLDINEQIAVGRYFKKIDETSVLLEQQLQTLKNLKQALLAKMFV